MLAILSYDKILEKMLSSISDELDKREGSVIYDALAPCAAELAQMYIELENALKSAFASTSSEEYLELRTSEMGIARLVSVKAIRKGTFRDSSGNLMDIPIGSRFSIDDLIYAAVEKISDGIFALECETAGITGNAPTGALLPVNYISGLGSAILSDIITSGTDNETDEKLLERYQLKVQEPVTSGNANEYKAWALDVSGVGRAKVIPLWNGNGTVKVIIIDTDMLPAESSIVSDVAEYIETVRPIGATVTVVSGTAKTVNISAMLTLDTGYTIDAVESSIITELTNYFQDVAFKTSFVSYARIGLIILSITGVLDYTNLMINDTQGNINLLNDEVPVLGTADLEVSS